MKKFIAIALLLTVASPASAGKAETPNLYQRTTVDAPACRTSAQIEKLASFAYARDEKMYRLYLTRRIMDGECHAIPKGTEVFLEEVHLLGNPCVRIIGEEIDCSFTSNSFLEIYPVHVTTRKSLGLMMRKLSVTESQRSAQFRGTFSRRKPSVASANWAQVA